VRAALEPPPGVEVAAVEGAVVLFGRVPRHLVARLRERASEVEGVTDVEDRLTPVDDGAGDAHRA
jgi:osmotically-inducible protein OsmY